MAGEIKTLNLQIVCNIGNYESIRVGAEFTPDGKHTIQENMQQVDTLLRDSVRVILEERANTANTVKPCAQSATLLPGAAQAPAAPAPAQEPAKPAAKKAAQANDERELLTFDDKRVQQIVKRLEKNPGQKDEILANVQKYYRCDDQVASVLGLAEKLI